MGSRRRGREFALQALYQADIAGTPVSAAFAGLWPGALEGDGLLTEGHVPESDEVELRFSFSRSRCSKSLSLKYSCGAGA